MSKPTSGLGRGAPRSLHVVNCCRCQRLCHARSSLSREELAPGYTCNECRTGRKHEPQPEQVIGGLHFTLEVRADGTRACGRCHKRISNLNPGPICFACEKELGDELSRRARPMKELAA